MVRAELPFGTVTFLFTDVEGSTKLLHALGAEGYADALAEHRRILREAFAGHGGIEVDTEGDAFFIAFPTAPGALAAASEATEALRAGPIKVRMGLHTGTPHLTDEGYVGADVHRAARIAAAGHGGQILVSAATAQLVDATALRDLGLHRLKDLNAAERIYQLGAEDHRPLKTLHQTNLPVPATAFLGREAEVAELSELLARDDVRLLTLTGPGGTGKTRLALQAAADAADAFAGGVWWVPLAALRDPALVLPSAAQALGASGDLAEHIADTRLLLLLDNFEHLVAAASELSPLLSRCSHLTLLVTSREPLHLAGEHEYAVDPLAPDEAIELFLTRAVAAKRDFAANGEVAQICARLDHLPLAIELAAARVKVLTPAALLERLEQRLPLLAGGARDAPERQRTLRATIEWSHELLADGERRLFARLAVFRGGCTLEAAEAVVDANLDTLQSLVDKSLVRVRDSGRFSMLETIREFALERLTSSGEADDLRRRHAAFFLAFAEEAEPHLRGKPQRWAERLQVEHDNVRAALDRFEEAGESQGWLRLAGAMTPFWYLRNHVVDGRRRLEAALAANQEPTPARAKALAGAATMAFGEAELDTAVLHGEAALALYRELNDPWGIAYSAMVLGNALADSSPPHLDRARELYEESVNGFRALGDAGSELRARYNFAIVLDELGETARGETLLEENLERARALGLDQYVAESLGGLAHHRRREGRYAEALPMLCEAARIEHELGDMAWAAIHLARIASALAIRGQLAVAAALLARADKLRNEIGVPWPQWALEMNQDSRTRIEEGLDELERPTAFERGRSLTFDEAIALALAEAVP